MAMVTARPKGMSRESKISITVVDLQKRIPLKTSSIIKAAQTVLKQERIKAAQLSIVFVSDSRIRFLNKKYLNEDHATDVLSFPTKTFGGDNFEVSGEIVISTDTAFKNAKIYRVTPSREILLYVVHGILHLLGYDDHRTSDIQKMRRKEQTLMNLIPK